MRVAVSGSSGLVGTALVCALRERGDDVQRLVRRPSGAPDEVAWSPARGELDRAALEGVDAVVHLAGEPIVGRWTPARRRRILESRVAGTGVLAREVAALDKTPRAFVCASAVGYYGDGGDTELTERAAHGSGFLAEVVEAWEAAAKPARDAGVRTVTLRSGIVLSQNGGALQRLLLPFRLGLGGRVGSGRQYWAWIGLHELVRIFLHAIDDDEMRGVYNAVGPEQTTNAQFTHALGRVVRRPTPFPVPGAALRLVMGALVDEMLLASQRVIPQRLSEAGYEFLDGSLEAALRRELGR